MLDKLIQLEKQLASLSENSQLPDDILLMFPETFRQVHSYKVFGENLLAIPANLKIEGDDDEFEIPFSFLNNINTIEVFESEFRPEIPIEFIQIGSLYGSTEIVLLNKLKNTIHIFHVADIADKNWLKHKLEKEICELNEFIHSIRPQTVCCLINPGDLSNWDIFEITNNHEVKNAGNLIKYPDMETSWRKLKELVGNSLTKGYEIHYAPKKLLIELGK